MTREFEADLGQGPEQMVAVYVPTDNLYLGDIVIASKASAVFPDLTVQEGVSVILTGGMALPDMLGKHPGASRIETS